MRRICLLFLLLVSVVFNNAAYCSYLFLGDTPEYTIYEGIDEQADIYNSGMSQTADVFGDIEIVQANQSSTINVFNGEFVQLLAYDSGEINYYDGYTDLLFAVESAKINLYGGTTTYLMSYESSIVNLYGYGFEIINYAEAIQGSLLGFPADGLLSGFWEDGTAFSIELGNYHGSDPVPVNPVTYEHLVLHEIPEPCTLLLFGFGGLVLRIRGRRREIVF